MNSNAILSRLVARFSAAVPAVAAAISFTTAMPVFTVESAQAFTDSTSTQTANGGSGGGNASQSARSASDKEDLSSILNIAAGVIYTTQCVSCEGSCAECGFIPISILSAINMNKASRQSGTASMQMAGYESGYNGGGEGFNSEMEGGDPSGNSAQIAKGIADLKKNMAKLGIKVSADGKKATLANGRQFDIEKGAAGDLAGMGLTPSEIDSTNALNEKFARDQAAKIAQFRQMKQADGAGGGGGGGAARSVASSDAGGRYGWGMDPRRGKRGAAQLSGLTKKLGDETIGVSGDNIFEMVTRRYKARDQRNDFLKD